MVQIILNTDETKYGGQGLIEEGQYLRRTINRRVDGLRNCLEVSLPSRTAQVELHPLFREAYETPYMDCEHPTIFHSFDSF
ncbi:1,4-alpha-glucan-branching enzyme 3, chloroplastic/amyloplastic [Vitis vinifera]|uniref:1,4-alpha-glucan-branching enzyme 3, chloroplastic/amyloplastic n=1 Tax=Vitis vinifera TaxID=29760 RepID=A0A438IS31_VITVI|nr:1,4-alpha-glucan-branching enzyme 3, chloroplastic/amyloplastic [Vitis vinifera]